MHTVRTNESQFLVVYIWLLKTLIKYWITVKVWSEKSLKVVFKLIHLRKNTKVYK